MTSSENATASDFDSPKLEALVEVMFLAAWADGELGPEERVQFARSVETLTDKRVEGGTFEALFERLSKQLSSEGRPARLATLKARLPDEAQRRVALALAVQVMAADGLIRTSERELIAVVAVALGIAGDEPADLVRDNAAAASG
ncbi:MAG: tellurite resistance TerB family protein [Polyangiaceae bacterium]